MFYYYYHIRYYIIKVLDYIIALKKKFFFCVSKTIIVDWSLLPSLSYVFGLFYNNFSECFNSIAWPLLGHWHPSFIPMAFLSHINKTLSKLWYGNPIYHQSVINHSLINQNSIIKNHQSILNQSSFNHQSIINQ